MQRKPTNDWDWKPQQQLLPALHVYWHTERNLLFLLQPPSEHVLGAARLSFDNKTWRAYFGTGRTITFPNYNGARQYLKNQLQKHAFNTQQRIVWEPPNPVRKPHQTT